MSTDSNPTTRINTKLKREHSTLPVGIELFYRGEKHNIYAAQLPFLIGRDKDLCQLAIESDVVSRIHCSIDIQDNQIGLFDRSTNGTSVKSGRNQGVVIKGKFYPLSSRGSIQLGAEISLDDPDLIHFKVLVNEVS